MVNPETLIFEKQEKIFTEAAKIDLYDDKKVDVTPGSLPRFVSGRGF